MAYIKSVLHKRVLKGSSPSQPLEGGGWGWDGVGIRRDDGS